MDARTERNLNGVHPDLVRVFRRAVAMDNRDVDPVVTEGLRTLARQKQLFAAKASKTLNSRHLTGHAIDVAFIIGGKVEWDWPLYGAFARLMKQAGRELKIPVEWGGDWKSFRDGPHFQLPWSRYPAK